MFDLEVFLYGFCYFDTISTKAINRTPLKSFKKPVTQQKRTTPPGVAGIRVWGGQSFLRGFYGNPTLRAMHSIHKCVAKGAPHLFH